MVAGGGAVECGLSIYLEDFARTIASRESHAVLEFAEALLVRLLQALHVLCARVLSTLLASSLSPTPCALFRACVFSQRMLSTTPSPLTFKTKNLDVHIFR